MPPEASTSPSARPKSYPAVTDPADPRDAGLAAWEAWAHASIAAADSSPPDTAEAADPAPPAGEFSSASEVVQLMVAARRAHRTGNYTRSHPLFLQARAQLDAAARSLGPRGAWLRAWLLLWMAHHDYARGAFTRAARGYARAAAAFHATRDVLGETTAVRGLGNICKYLGLYAQAAEHYDRAIELARDCGDAVGVAAAEHNHGNILVALGDMRAAAATYRRAIAAFRKARRPDLVRHATVSLATTAQRRGRHHDALRLLRQAAPPGSAGHLHAGDEAERLIAVAEAESGLGRQRAALDTLARAIAFARASGEAHTEALAHRTHAAMLLVARHDPAEVLTEARRGLRCSRAAKSPTELTGELHELAARASGRCGAWREAARHSLRALEEQKRLAAHRGRQRADTLALNRELAQARHRAELARVENARLSEALAEIATRLEAEKSGRSARAVDAITPESLRGLGLRPRECEVLHWLVRGKSNEEIAIILGCSAETVKSHLKRIYTQLDVTNRTSATARALAAASA